MSTHPAIEEMLATYSCERDQDYLNALREIMQSIALLAFTRTDFFQRAAFYGGTALRLLYNLNRGSEDLDFTLLQREADFALENYATMLQTEFAAWGLHATFARKSKASATNIQSGFLKGNTQAQLLSIGLDEALARHFHPQSEIKIKVEVDVCPPDGIATQMRYLYQPIPFAVRTCTLPVLLADKLHAVLFRNWRTRVKGRDWYDLLWYAGKHPDYDLRHLEARSRHSGDYDASEPLSAETVQELLRERLEALELEAVKADVLPFLRNPAEVSAWSKELFLDAFQRLHSL